MSQDVCINTDGDFMDFSRQQRPFSVLSSQDTSKRQRTSSGSTTTSTHSSTPRSSSSTPTSSSFQYFEHVVRLAAARLYLQSIKQTDTFTEIQQTHLQLMRDIQPFVNQYEKIWDSSRSTIQREYRLPGRQSPLLSISAVELNNEMIDRTSFEVYCILKDLLELVKNMFSLELFNIVVGGLRCSGIAVEEETISSVHSALLLLQLKLEDSTRNRLPLQIRLRRIANCWDLFQLEQLKSEFKKELDFYEEAVLSSNGTSIIRSPLRTNKEAWDANRLPNSLQSNVLISHSNTLLSSQFPSLLTALYRESFEKKDQIQETIQENCTDVLEHASRSNEWKIVHRFLKNLLFLTTGKLLFKASADVMRFLINQGIEIDSDRYASLKGGLNHLQERTVRCIDAKVEALLQLLYS